MPSGKVFLQISAKNKPSIDSLFKSLQKSQIIEISAELKKEDKRKWRPEGINKYGLLIYSIEKIDFSHLNSYEIIEKTEEFYKDIGLVPKYKIIGKLVSMNGYKNEFPAHFCYPSNGMKDKVELYLFGRKSVLVYEEYLTL